MSQESISMRQAGVLPLFIGFGLLLVYGGVLAAEAISVTPLVLSLRDDVGIPGTLLRIAILSLTAVPIAGLTGYWLRTRVPERGSQVVLAVAVLWVLVILTLQILVYERSVMGASILKIVFVVAPLLFAGTRTRTRELA